MSDARNHKLCTGQIWWIGKNGNCFHISPCPICNGYHDVDDKRREKRADGFKEITEKESTT